MKHSFCKYHGTGNDFILADNRDGWFQPDKARIEKLCHRRFGIGSDGLITLESASGFDFGMNYYNADGNESTMCGNGGRCIVAFADFLSPGGNSFRFTAADGAHTGKILSKEGDIYTVKLSMNDVTGYKNQGEDFIIDTGSPHVVKFINDIENIDIVREGRIIRNLAEFQPGGINVNFVKVEEDQIFVRTYERGVEDETLSCGTGVTASALAYASTRHMDGGIVSIMTRGGALKLHFKRNWPGFTGIFLEGPAIKVFDGVIEI